VWQETLQSVGEEETSLTLSAPMVHSDGNLKNYKNVKTDVQ
jgi:hypothetical protein